ncbi:AAA family ATPase [Nonomuraea sp. bgisy101]|uniref:AAA family ATPase n=1 Tax=Nonomuraea sp. bgisy101 TaxID=3413784 RepID=UPI003D712E63
MNVVATTALLTEVAAGSHRPPVATSLAGDSNPEPESNRLQSLTTPGNPPVIHGRRREREAITRLLADARGGRSGALVLRGEAGIGKSALLRHAAESAATSEPMRVLACAGVESEVEHAFSGLLGLLRPVLHHLDALPGVQAGALRGALGLTDSAAPDFSVSDFLVSAAVLTLLAAVAADRPLLVVVDDVQWLDHASAAALLFAARRLADEPLAMLLAVREPEPLPVNTAGLTELVLHGLPQEEAALLLEEHGWTLPVRQRDALFTATAGNPLALIELARLFQARRERAEQPRDR